MDNNGPSTAQTIASVLWGGLGGYIDSQNNQPIYAQQPLPQTAYGYQGTSQPSVAGSISGIPPIVLVAGLVIVAVVLLRKRA